MHLGSQFLQKLNVVTGLRNLDVKKITSEENSIPDLEDLEVGSSILHRYWSDVAMIMTSWRICWGYTLLQCESHKYVTFC